MRRRASLCACPAAASWRTWPLPATSNSPKAQMERAKWWASSCRRRASRVAWRACPVARAFGASGCVYAPHFRFLCNVSNGRCASLYSNAAGRQLPCTGLPCRGDPCCGAHTAYQHCCLLPQYGAWVPLHCVPQISDAATAVAFIYTALCPCLWRQHLCTSNRLIQCAASSYLLVNGDDKLSCSVGNAGACACPAVYCASSSRARRRPFPRQ